MNRGRVAAGILHAEAAGLAQNRLDAGGAGGRRGQVRGGLGVYAAGEEVTQCQAIIGQDADHGVLGPKDFPGRLTERAQHLADVAL